MYSFAHWKCSELRINVHTYADTYAYSGTSLQRTLWELESSLLYRGFHSSEVILCA